MYPPVSSVKPGAIIRFDYPAANYRGARPRLEPRAVRVVEVRDLVAKPLDPTTVAIDPELARDRYLVTGQDLDRGAERSFYLASMRRLRPDDESPRLGLWTVLLVDQRGENSPEFGFEAESDWEATAWAESWNGKRAGDDDPIAVVRPPDLRPAA